MKNKLINLKGYFISNWKYITVMCVFLLIFIIQNQLVVLYADDLFLGNIANQNGLLGAIEKVKIDYFTWMGGPTSGIAVFFLCFDIYLWRIINPLIILLISIFTIRMITHNNENKKMNLVLAFGFWFFINTLNLSISRETIYWLDGSLAYVLTLFFTYAYIFYLSSRLILKTKHRKYDMFLLPLIAFFAGWNGPQAGTMAVIAPILIFIWIIFINREKIRLTYLISWIFSVIGFAIYYFAPGNQVRMLTGFKDFAAMNLIEKIFYRLPEVMKNTFDTTLSFSLGNISFIAIIMILLMGIKIIIDNKSRNKLLMLSVFINSVFVVCKIYTILGGYLSSIINKGMFTYFRLYDLYINSNLRLVHFIPYVISIIVLICTIYISFEISKKYKSPLIIIMLLIGYMSQFVMVFSPYNPYRSLFIPCVFLVVTILMLIPLLNINKKYLYLSLIGILVLYDISLAVTCLIVFIIADKLLPDEQINSIKNLTLTLIFSAILFSNLYNVTIGYYRNNKIYNENVKAIENFKSNNQIGDLKLIKLPIDSEIYGFTPFSSEGWIAEAVRAYYKLREDVKLVIE
jgi:hypothetical protein